MPPPPRLRATDSIQVIDRAVAILRCFTEQTPELSVSELSRRLGLHKSTVSRILAALQRNGLVAQNPDTGRYRLGLGLIPLAGVALGRLSLRGAAQPVLGPLVEITQETINVTVLDGDACVHIERAASPQPVHYLGWIGRRIPAHCTAAGKALLAHLPADERAAFLRLTLPAFTPHTITDPVALTAELDQLRRQGYAIVHEEFEEGVSEIAAPVFDHAGKAAGAICISGPSFRMGRGQIEAFVEPLLRTTGAISAQLGFVSAR